VDENSAEAIYEYFLEQHLFSAIPKHHQLLIERITTDDEKYTIVHSMFGRRVNDALSRAVGFVLSKLQKTDVEITINDNGFLVKSQKHLNVKKALEMLLSDKLELVMKSAIDKSEILKRRFRHVAARGLMILENYRGRTKRVGKQQVSSMILLKAVERISKDFPLLKEARREVLQIAMDLPNATVIVKQIEDKSKQLLQKQGELPSPFGFNLATQGHTEIMKAEDKTEFLRSMHRLVLAKIGKRHNRVRELILDSDEQA
jgi:ATP-dependent helicase Lhr and Lhr-like helicase